MKEIETKTNLNRLRFENVAIAESGGIHSSIIDRDGKLYTFGWGSHGRLGHQKYIKKIRFMIFIIHWKVWV